MGAVGLSTVTLAYHWLFFRFAFKSGLYTISVMFVMFAGGVLGIGTGYALSQTNPLGGGLAGIFSSGLVAVQISFVCWLSASPSSAARRNHGLDWGRVLGQIVFAIPTLVWMVFLLWWGLRLILVR